MHTAYLVLAAVTAFGPAQQTVAHSPLSSRVMTVNDRTIMSDHNPSCNDYHPLAARPDDDDSEQQHPKRIAVVVACFNAGVTTRGLQIAKALLARHDDAEIRVFSWNTAASMEDDDWTYEAVIHRDGFELTKYGEPFQRSEWNDMLRAEQSGQGFSSNKLMESLQRRVEACTQALVIQASHPAGWCP